MIVIRAAACSLGMVLLLTAGALGNTVASAAAHSGSVAVTLAGTPTAGHQQPLSYRDMEGRSTVLRIDYNGIDVKGSYGTAFLPMPAEQIADLRLRVDSVVQITSTGDQSFELMNLSDTQAARGPATVRSIGKTGIQTADADGATRFIALTPSQVKQLRLHDGSRVMLTPLPGAPGHIRISTM